MAREWFKPYFDGNGEKSVAEASRLHARLDRGLSFLSALQQDLSGEEAKKAQHELDDVIHDLVTALSGESSMAPGLMVDRTEDGEVLVAAKDATTGLAMAGSLTPDQARIFAKHLLANADAIDPPPQEPNVYHQHLNVCAHCRDNPFDLCPEGVKAWAERELARFREPEAENLVSRGLVPRGREVPTATVLDPAKLPKAPPGRKR